MPINRTYHTISELPETLAVFPIEGAILFPRAQIPLNIFEPRYLNMIDDCLRSDRFVGIIQPNLGSPHQTPPTLYQIGTLGRITEFAESGDGRYIINVTGIARFQAIEELSVITPYRQMRVQYEDFSADLLARAGEEEANRQGFIQALRDLSIAQSLNIDWDNLDNAPTEAVINAVSMMAPLESQDKQALLEAPDLKARAEVFMAATAIATATEQLRKATLQ